MNSEQIDNRITNSQGGRQEKIEEATPQTFRTNVVEGEVDVSTSTENLTPEERYVVRHTTRQEPQGEESSDGNVFLNDSRENSLKRSPKFLEPHGLGPPSAGKMNRGDTANNAGTTFMYSDPRTFTKVMPQAYLERASVFKNPSKDTSTKGSSSRFAAVNPGFSNEDNFFPNVFPKKDLVFRDLPRDLPRDLNCDVLPPPPPPPLYPGVRHGGEFRKEKSLSLSQPDLARLGYPEDGPRKANTFSLFRSGNKDLDTNPDHSKEMIEILVRENGVLKQELEVAYKKISRVTMLENELIKVQQDHEELMKALQRRDMVESTTRRKLQIEVQRLRQVNQQLQKQVDLMTQQLMEAVSGSNADALVSQLIAQRRELVGAKERGELEIATQRVAIQDQRQHINVLDTALAKSTQKLDEELLKKQICVERYGQLQHAYALMQAALERRDEQERRMRRELETEIQELRSKRDGSEKEDETHSNQLKKHLHSAEDRIQQLEQEVGRLQHRSLQDIVLQHASLDSDMRLAALEKSGEESPKMIAHGKVRDRMAEPEDRMSSNKASELEERIKALEVKVTEKDGARQRSDDSGYIPSSPSHSKSHAVSSSASGEDFSNELFRPQSATPRSPYAGGASASTTPSYEYFSRENHRMPLSPAKSLGRPEMEPHRLTRSEMEPSRLGRQEMEPSRLGRSEMEPSRLGRAEMEPPRLGRPEMEPPRLGRPEMEPPRLGRPDMEPPRLGRPEMEPPRLGRSEMEEARLGRPEMEPPSVHRNLRSSLRSSGATATCDVLDPRVTDLSAMESLSPGGMKESSIMPKRKSTEETAKEIDDKLKELDAEIYTKDSLMQALSREKERYPNHYWMV